jgi:hypothetical protein
VRGAIGEGAVLTVAAAVRELGVREADGVAWLREHGCIRTLRLPSGRAAERVVWRRVLAALEADETPTTTPTRRAPALQPARSL